MKKSIAALLFLLLLVGAAGAYLFQQRAILKESPFNREIPFDSLSKAISGSHHNMYLIDNAKKTIHKLDTEGRLIYTIASDKGKDGEVYRFNDMTVDENGNLYTIRALLDSYGLTVKSEQIVKYSSEGKFDKILFTVEYSDPTKKRYRVGSLRNLQVHNGDLYFFSDESWQMLLYRAPAGGSEARAIYAVQLPENKYLSEADGIEPGRMYYSTRSGEIYRVTEAGQSEMVYPLPGIDRTRRNFPESMRLDQQGRLVFIDFNSRAVSRFDPKDPFVVESLITDKQAQANGFELAFDTTSSIVTPDNNIIITEANQIIRRLPDGTLSEPLTHGVYSRAHIREKWLVWSVAAVAVLLLLYAIKLLYFQILQRRVSLLLKQTLIFVPVVAASMILLSTMIYTSFSKKLEEETTSELALLAKNGQNLIDGDKLESLVSPLDYRGPVYQSFRQKIKSVFDNDDFADNQGFYKAVYKYENGAIYRIMEDDDEMHMFNPFPLTPKNSEVVNYGRVATDQWQDDSGYWMYAIAPIYNSSGQVVGIFETSKNMEGILKHRRGLLQSIIQNIALISVGLLLILMLMSFLLLSSIRKLRNSVGEIAKGNWDTVVTINSRDEVQELGEHVNLMAARIREYITKVENFSQSYYRFVPQQFLRILHKETILDVQLGDQVEENMSILICNIRGFYRISKDLSPEENFNFVNSFLNRFGPYVRNHQGMVNKYLGAGFIGMFPGNSDEALTACLEMRRELELYNQQRAQAGYKPIDVGIGLHKGPMRLGIIGEEQRLEGNVISDGVNLTTMLEKMTEPLGASILMTEHVVAALGESGRFQYRDLGLIEVEGSNEPLHLYDLYQGEPETVKKLKDKTKAIFEEAVMLYQVGRFYDARESFLKVIKQNRQDKAAQLYFYICDEYYHNGTNEEWNGTLSVS